MNNKLDECFSKVKFMSTKHLWHCMANCESLDELMQDCPQEIKDAFTEHTGELANNPEEVGEFAKEQWEGYTNSIMPF